MKGCFSWRKHLAIKIRALIEAKELHSTLGISDLKKRVFFQSKKMFLDTISMNNY